MDSYIPQLPPLRLPQQISQLLNQLSTTRFRVRLRRGRKEHCQKWWQTKSRQRATEISAWTAFFKHYKTHPWWRRWWRWWRRWNWADRRIILPAHTSANKRSKNGTYEENSGATRRGGSATNSANENSSSKWLIQKYFQQFNDSWNARMRDGGEPQGIVAAPEPSVCPPIQPVGLVESSAMDTELESGSMTFNSDNAGSSSSAVSFPSSWSVAAHAAAASHSSKKKKLSPSKSLSWTNLTYAIGSKRSRSLAFLIESVTSGYRDSVQVTTNYQDFFAWRFVWGRRKWWKSRGRREGLIEDDSDTHHLDHSHHDHQHQESLLSIRTPTSTVADLKMTVFSKQEDILGCQHYQREMQIRCASTCYKWWYLLGCVMTKSNLTS